MRIRKTKLRRFDRIIQITHIANSLIFRSKSDSHHGGLENAGDDGSSCFSFVGDRLLNMFEITELATADFRE